MTAARSSPPACFFSVVHYEPAGTAPADVVAAALADALDGLGGGPSTD